MDEIWKRDEVDSPCVKICVVHPIANICVGCFRTMEEIENWSNFDAEKRREITLELPKREKSLKTRRKGRARR